MAIDILLGKDGDIDLTNRAMTLTSTIEQSAVQQVLITLSMYRGEWVFNTNQGVPYLKNANNSMQLLGKSNKNLLDHYIRKGILSAENIAEILTYSSSVDKVSRVATVSFTALTLTGEIVSGTDISLN